MRTVKQHRTDIIKKMKDVNTYNKSFNNVVDVLARTLYDYENIIEEFEEGGGQVIVEHTNRNNSTNIIKNPMYLALEKLRDDVVAYSKELGLTPTGLKRLNDELDSRGGTSKLENVLNELKNNG